MLGGGPATATDDGRPRSKEPACVLLEVLRRGKIQEPPVDDPGQAGVGHGREGTRGEGRHRADHVQDTLGADSAVGAQDIQVQGLQCAHHPRNVLPGQGLELFGEGELPDDGKVADPLRGPDRDAQLLHVGEGLEQEQVYAAFQQSLRLLLVDGSQLLRPHRYAGAEGQSRRAEGARHEDRLAGYLPRLPGDPGPRSVYLPDPVLQAVGRQLEAIAAEGVGLDELRARREVAAVNALHQVRLREVQLLETAAVVDPFCVEHGAHGAVGQKRTLLEPVKKGVGHGCLAFAEIILRAEREACPELRRRVLSSA